MALLVSTVYTRNHFRAARADMRGHVLAPSHESHVMVSCACLLGQLGRETERGNMGQRPG